MKKIIRVLLGLAFLGIGIYAGLALISYQPTDTSWHTSSTMAVQNWLGTGGANIADILKQLFGKLSVFVPIAVFVFGIFLLRQVKWLWFRFIMFSCALAGACWLIGGSAIIRDLTSDEAWTKVEAGGFIGFYLRAWFPAPTDMIKIIGWVVVSICFIFGLKVPFFLICQWGSKTVTNQISHIKLPHISLPRRTVPVQETNVLVEQEEETSEDVQPVQETKSKSLFSGFKKSSRKTVKERIEPTFDSLNLEGVEKPTKPKKIGKEKSRPVGKSLQPVQTGKDSLELPSSDLLGAVIASTTPALSQDKMNKISRDLEQVLAQFGVSGKVVGAQCGPVVTLYEFEPAPGIKTSRIIALADDVAMKMCVASVRIAVIPGMNALGIEIPNPKRETVYIREMVESIKFQGNNGLLPLILGKDIGGIPVFADLAKMPHLLVAGTTGSGKSVAINTMILSLLYRFTPAECRLIMVDPKMVELSVYNRIPHLLTPVVIEPEKAVVALKWAVREMEDRYRSMMYLGVRGIESYNQKLLQAAKEGKNITRRVQTGFDPETGKPIYEEQNFDLTPFPFIVIIVDEMADLMGQCGKEVDPLIQRLAQKSRAVGIHLILATQRPSVDVVTGTIKSNFPSRISFQVRSKTDSRTILDESGAEQLLGRGDMLYMPAGQKPQRVHGPYVSDDDVQRVVTHWEMQAEPEYLDAVITDVEGGSSGTSNSGKADLTGGSGDLYDQAVQIVLRDKKPTTSYIQRQLRIGYNKAADLIDRMEAEGIVSKPNIAGKREILVPTDNA